jgi:hypothetical protein
MKDHECVKLGVVQFDLGSYANPVWILHQTECLGTRLGTSTTFYFDIATIQEGVPL